MINPCNSRTLASILSYKHRKQSSVLVALARRRIPWLVSVNNNNIFHRTSSFWRTVCGWSSHSRGDTSTHSTANGMTRSYSSPVHAGTGSIDAKFEWNPKRMMEELTAAAPMVEKGQWMAERCWAAFENYQNHLKHYSSQPQRTSSRSGSSRSATTTATRSHNDHDDDSMTSSSAVVHSSTAAVLAIRCLVKSKLPTLALRHRIREVERTIGSLADRIPMTDALSFVLLEAHGKAGNVGRAMSLLEYRRIQNYHPYNAQHAKEFYYAVQSIVSGGVEYRMARNPKKPEGASKCKLDDPTRWLDCILLNMHRRGVQLDIHLANAMLATFSSTGRTGRALHFFYQLKPIPPIHLSSTSTNSSNNQKRVKMVRKGPPPSYQLPSQSMNFATLNTDTTTAAIKTTMNNSSSTKLSKELDPKWSLPLTAAFDFAKSISQGACGHEPIQLDISSYNILLKACCYRGALCRAIHLIRKEIPNLGLEPNTVTYNTLMHGLARVADTTSLREFLTEMVNKNIRLSEYTVQAIVLGYLNSGDAGGAITLVQDIFNQHSVLPPYTSHLDILEHCLVNELLFEAKRHVYFIQQVWKFVPPHHMTRDKLNKIKFVQNSPKLGKEALKKLFEYHGETLTDADFF